MAETDTDNGVKSKKTALVIGAGPAGLMAAEELARAGLSVTIAEAKPSAGRKFLMAGKSGLNLTMNEPLEAFLSHYGAAAEDLRPSLTDFGPEAVQEWARGLGQKVFTGSTGRVFPNAMKASPLLRAWMARLGGLGVTLNSRWRWVGWQGDALAFETPDGAHLMTPAVTVLALGGASWARLGSNGDWAGLLESRGVLLSPFKPSNVGLKVNWSPHMARHFGTPVKAVRLHAGAIESRGEIVISARGLEGGGVYTVSSAVRDGSALTLDLLPDQSLEQIVTRLSRPRGKASLSNFLRKAIRLDPARLALLMEFGRPLPEGTALAPLLKALPVHHDGPRPMDEAISTAGGVAFSALDQGLMLRDVPGVFVAGEMTDWEAPTGGYLITACLATGRHAGRAAATWATQSDEITAPAPG